MEMHIGSVELHGAVDDDTLDQIIEQISLHGRTHHDGRDADVDVHLTFTGQDGRMLPDDVTAAIMERVAGRRMERRAAAAAQAGTHLWFVLVPFVIDDEEGGVINLAARQPCLPPQVACYNCEVDWKADTVGTRCPGDPPQRP